VSFHDNGLTAERRAEAPLSSSIGGAGLLPAAMSMEQAQAYSGFSRKHLNRLITTGKLDRRRVGYHGGYIVRRDQLDAAIAEAFASTPNSVETDFRFG
jgi:hypothetical protein